jgi:hypothetical protein
MTEVDSVDATNVAYAQYSKTKSTKYFNSP